MSDLPPHWNAPTFREALSLIAEFSARGGCIVFLDAGAPYIEVRDQTPADFQRVSRLKVELLEILGPAGLSNLDDEDETPS